MFNQLIESKAQKQKMAGGTVFSIVLHTVLIGAAVYATARAGVKDDKAKAEKIQFVEMKKEPPKVPDKPPPKEVIVKPPPPKGFQVLRAPVRIDIKIPEIDLSKAITNESDFSGKGVKGGTGTGVVGGRSGAACGRGVAGDADHALAAGARRPARRVQPVDAAAGAGGAFAGASDGGAPGGAGSSRRAAAAAHTGYRVAA